MISARNISKHYHQYPVLRDISFSVTKRERIGLVGPNGVGKSTLLKILAAIVEPDSGKVIRQQHVRVGYLPQELEPSDSKETVREFLRRISKAQDTDLSSSNVAPLLARLDLQQEVLDRPLSSLSGGEKTKIALVRILLSHYDLYLLDEPTNNLDLPALLLLERFVQESNGGFIIVSHDREFLDRLVKRVIEIDEFSHRVYFYEGNFSDYLRERMARIERLWERYEDYEREVKRIRESIREKQRWAARGAKQTAASRDSDKLSRGHARDRARKIGEGAKAIEKRLERIERVEKPREKLPLKIGFEIRERSGDRIVDLVKVEKQIGDRTLGPIDLAIRHHDRMALLGPNGSGKTTLVKIILGEVKPDIGEVKVGTRVKVGYLPQEPKLRPTLTVLEEFLRDSPLEQATGRKLLNRFGLSQEDMSKRVSQLSPGERSRLILAKLMAQEPNFLVLDEPSNHLDLEALEQLEGALADFKGTLFLVTHDRYLLDRVGVTKTYVLEKGGMLREVTDYRAYERAILAGIVSA